MFCLADIVRDNAAERPDKPALICDERTLTYAELNAEASLVANALLAAGVENQDRVGIIAKNIPEYFTLTYGAAKINAVSVAVNWRLAPAEMGYILDNAEVGVVLVEDEFLGHLDTMELPRNPLIVAIGGGTGHLSYTWLHRRGYVVTYLRCDVIAEGVVAAAREVSLQVPLVVRLEGTNVDLGKNILAESGLAIIAADNLADAAAKIVHSVKEAQ